MTLSNCENCKYYSEDGCYINPSYLLSFQMLMQHLPSGGQQLIEQLVHACPDWETSEDLQQITAEVTLTMATWKWLAEFNPTTEVEIDLAPLSNLAQTLTGYKHIPVIEVPQTAIATLEESSEPSATQETEAIETTSSEAASTVEATSEVATDAPETSTPEDEIRLETMGEPVQAMVDEAEIAPETAVAATTTETVVEAVVVSESPFQAADQDAAVPSQPMAAADPGIEIPESEASEQPENEMPLPEVLLSNEVLPEESTAQEEPPAEPEHSSDQAAIAELVSHSQEIIAACSELTQAHAVLAQSNGHYESHV